MDESQSNIAVLILDDQLVQREGIARVVEASGTMHVVQAASTGEEAMRICASQPIDLALIDLVLGGQRGTAIGRELRQACPSLKVIIYTREKSMVLAAEIFRERQELAQPGLQGYILTRNISSSQYLQEVYAQILESGYYIDPDVLRWHYQMTRTEPLTRREEECALLLAEGLGNAEIARRMGISLRRVENLISELYLKFHIAGDPGDPARRVLLAEGVRLIYSDLRRRPRLKVLIIDDNATFLARLSQELDAHEQLHVIATASSGQAGIDLARLKKPDLVLVDIRLPDTNGFRVARQILQEDAQAWVILQSTETNEVYQEEAQRLGALALLPKNKVSASALLELCFPGAD